MNGNGTVMVPREHSKAGETETGDRTGGAKDEAKPYLKFLGLTFR